MLTADYYIAPEHLSRVLPNEDPALIQDIILDVWYSVVRLAPVVAEGGLNENEAGLVTSIIRQAVLDWVKSDGGVRSYSQETNGPFSKMETVDTKQERRGLLKNWQVEALKDLQHKYTEFDGKARAIEVELATGYSDRDFLERLWWGD